MNEKGFTLIELITTFALSIVIIVLLINVVLVIKDVYYKNDIKTNLLIEQSNLSHLINKKMTYNSLRSYRPCVGAEFCYDFEFVDGTTSTLKVSNDSITFDNYVYKVIGGTTIGDPTIERINMNVSSDDSFLVIKVPITNKLYPKEDFGLNIVYQYNSKIIAL